MEYNYKYTLFVSVCFLKDFLVYFNFFSSFWYFSEVVLFLQARQSNIAKRRGGKYKVDMVIARRNSRRLR